MVLDSSGKLSATAKKMFPLPSSSIMDRVEYNIIVAMHPIRVLNNAKLMLMYF
jgi:hypothetical protein